jgi:hypothetical protein
VEILIDLFQAGELLDHLVASGPLLHLLHVQGVQLVRLLQDRIHPDVLFKQYGLRFIKSVHIKFRSQPVSVNVILVSRGEKCDMSPSYYCFSFNTVTAIIPLIKKNMCLVKKSKNDGSRKTSALQREY